jgi:hypothetical protein
MKRDLSFMFVYGLSQCSITIHVPFNPWVGFRHHKEGEQQAYNRIRVASVRNNEKGPINPTKRERKALHYPT